MFLRRHWILFMLIDNMSLIEIVDLALTAFKFHAATDDILGAVRGDDLSAKIATYIKDTPQRDWLSLPLQIYSQIMHPFSSPHHGSIFSERQPTVSAIEMY